MQEEKNIRMFEPEDENITLQNLKCESSNASKEVEKCDKQFTFSLEFVALKKSFEIMEQQAR